MPQIGATLPRRQLGRLLREGRHEMGMSLEKAAELAELSPSGLQRLEKGEGARKIRIRDIAELCRIYELDGKLTEACKGFAQQAGEPSWWHEYGHLIPANFDVYVSFEAAARQIFSYCPDVVLGLLQTPEYSRALLCAALPGESAVEIDQRVQIKGKRQLRLTRKSQVLNLDVVLMECALRRVVGSRRIMAAQLRHLADLSTLPNVELRVLPFSAGIPLGDPITPFSILDFGLDAKNQPVQPPVVYLENYVGDLYLEKSRDVERYDEAYQAIRAAASSPTASRNLIRQIAKEYAT